MTVESEAVFIQNPDPINESIKDYLGADSGTARCWPDILSQLPKDVFEDEASRHVRSFVRGYFVAQRRLADGEKVKARRKLDGLSIKPGFLKFEADNEPLFAAIEIAVRGKSNRQDESGKPIKPSFTNIKV